MRIKCVQKIKNNDLVIPPLSKGKRSELRKSQRRKPKRTPKTP